MIIQTECKECDGSGQIIRNKCSACNGNGHKEASVLESINIPCGVDNGSLLRISKKGNSVAGGPNGDLIIKIKIQADKYFRRDGYDIHTFKEIPFTKAVFGGPIQVRTLYGVQTINLSPCTNHNDVKKIAFNGVPKLPPNQFSKGNHYVHIKIAIPKTLSENAAKALQDYAMLEIPIEDQKI